MSNFFDFREQMFSSRRKKREDAALVVAGSNAGATLKETLSVSQLTHVIDSAIQKGVPSTVQVHGELSNVSARHASGHLYFTLKDAKNCIDCVMWRSDFVKLKFEPGDGEEVLCTGNVAVYGQRGRYQLYVRRIEPIGKGALELAYRQLYTKLEKEGLFDAARKRELPRYPMRVALVTSRDGAALQDMLKVLRRFPWVKRLICPVPVQGAGAAEKIASTLHALGRQAAAKKVDVVVLARGGGSLEDLWAFNEEVVARAVLACSVPVITGIGHEVDTSIADLVADHHAHTPTEAASVVVGYWSTARDELDVTALRLRRALSSHVNDCRRRFSSIERHEFFRRPTDRINHLRQRLDDRQRELAAVLARRMRGCERSLLQCDARLRRHHPRHQIRLIDERVTALAIRMAGALRGNMQRDVLKLNAADAHLQAISPQAVLKRGYSITTLKKGGKVIRSVEQLEPGDAILTRVADGQVESTVEDQKQSKLFE